MIRDAIRAVRLFRSDSRAETVLALAVGAGVVLSLLNERR